MNFSIGFLFYDFYEKRYATNYMYPGCQRQPTLTSSSQSSKREKHLYPGEARQATNLGPLMFLPHQPKSLYCKLTILLSKVLLTLCAIQLGKLSPRRSPLPCPISLSKTYHMQTEYLSQEF